MTSQDSQVGPSDSSATQRAYDILRRMIVTGDLRAGEKLKIDALRTRIEIGASPIREALSLLTSDNLVERIDQRGFRAANISKQNFTEILTLRCTLEDLALRQSIQNATTQWEENLVLAHHRLTRAQRENTAQFHEMHKAFHMALLQNANAPILQKTCAQLYDLSNRYRYLASKLPAYESRHLASDHSDILNAAIDRDAETASTRLLDHYRKTSSVIADLLREKLTAG